MKQQPIYINENDRHILTVKGMSDSRAYQVQAGISRWLKSEDPLLLLVLSLNEEIEVDVLATVYADYEEDEAAVLNDVKLGSIAELLSEMAHEAWVEWMKGIEFEKLGVSQWKADNWRRLMDTPYSDLPDVDKETSRVVAREILPKIEHLLCTA